MKTRIAVGAGLLLTLSTAVAGTLMYGRGAVAHPEAVSGADAAVTPELIAMWRATSTSDDYIAPKVPI